MYKAYDRDHSGTIGADELPAAFKAAGEGFFFSTLFKRLHRYLNNIIRTLLKLAITATGKATAVEAVKTYKRASG